METRCIYLKKVDWSKNIRSISHRKNTKEDFQKYLYLRLLKDYKMSANKASKIELKDIDFQKKQIVIEVAIRHPKINTDILVYYKIKDELFLLIEKYISIFQPTKLLFEGIGIQSLFPDSRLEYFDFDKAEKYVYLLE